jgi:hypothetical protein
MMNVANLEDSRFVFDDGFLPVKILAGEGVFERLASQRTSHIFGITEAPWAAAAYRINELIVQLEPNLSEWDSIAIAASGNARLLRHNTVIYELHCTFPPDVTGLHSNFFYRCPECNGHIYECAHLLVGNSYRPEPSPSTSLDAETAHCPDCGGKTQSLALGVSFCLDCDWECGLAPIR